MVAMPMFPWIDSNAGAAFSPCRTWRHALWRTWDGDSHPQSVAFIGLNPSTADETKNDPTIRRCIRFSKDWGYSGLVMLNAFAFRATDPRDMKAAPDPNGPYNDDALVYYGRTAPLIIAAWGVHCPPERAKQICRLIGRDIHCLGLTKGGHPRHPLYMPANSRPQIYYRPE